MPPLSRSVSRYAPLIVATTVNRHKKDPLPHWKGPYRHTAHLPVAAAGFGTVLTAQRAAGGCRGFVGPVPPPLWISVSYAIVRQSYGNCPLLSNGAATAHEPWMPAL